MGPSAQPPSAIDALRGEALSRRRYGDLEGAFQIYEQAIALAPSDQGLLKELADLAVELDMPDVALGVWTHLRAADPVGSEIADGYARALIGAARFPEAIEVLKAALHIAPQEPRLWATLGVGLTYAGRAREALPVFEEGLTLAPDLASLVYNRGLALLDLGRVADAETDFRAASGLTRKASERATIDFSLAAATLARGDLERGWSLYEGRLSPDLPKAAAFEAPGQRLAADTAIAGRSILVLAEQGISEEIMFANALPALVDEVGPSGRVVLAVESRLVELFQRSFPSVEVCAHATPRVGLRPLRRTRDPVHGSIDFWVPLASLMQRYRRSLGDFPRAPFLRAHPDRIRHWRAWLGSERPAFGLTWRSGKLAGSRQRLAPPLRLWADLMATTPGAQFVNIQYGDSAADVAELETMSGVEIRQPPDLNIRDDLDDLAALCSAMQGVVGIQNATSVLAAACGASVQFVTGPASWFQLGQDAVPWFAEAEIAATDDYGDWSPAMRTAAGGVRRAIEGFGPRPGDEPGAIEPYPTAVPAEARPAGASKRVYCVLRAGGDYQPMHVGRLQRQLARHLPGAELVCLSDVTVPCRRIPLRGDWSGVRGWWAKMELFAPWVEGDLLYFDLDTSLVGDLGDVAAVNRLTMLEDFTFPGRLGSGVMFLPEAERRQVWETFSQDPMHWIRRYDDPGRGDARWGDQAFLEDHGLGGAQRWQSVTPGQVYSYKAHDLRRRGMPEGARIICFHGQPRPWAADVPSEFQGA